MQRLVTIESCKGAESGRIQPLIPRNGWSLSLDYAAGSLGSKFGSQNRAPSPISRAFKSPATLSRGCSFWSERDPRAGPGLWLERQGAGPLAADARGSVSADGDFIKLGVGLLRWDGSLWCSVTGDTTIPSFERRHQPCCGCVCCGWVLGLATANKFMLMELLQEAVHGCDVDAVHAKRLVSKIDD